MADLVLENVWKKYGDVVALKGVSFKVQDGELITILGPSGAGKTSLLQSIAGVEEIQAGKIYIEGQRIDHLPPFQRNVAMIFETYALYPNKTVYENMAFPLRSPYVKLSKEEINQRVKKISAMLQIDWLLDRNVSQLSGGQKQRVALGRMLVRNPKLFLMDEPIAHLDAKLRHRLRAELKNIQRTFGITTLYTTHDYREALGMGDRVVILNQGMIVQIGTPEDVYTAPRNDFVAGLVGDPPMNFFEGTFFEDGGKLTVRTPAFHQTLSEEISNVLRYLNRNITKVGLRPSDIILSREELLGSFAAQIYVVEPLGVVKIITLERKGVKFQVKYMGSDNFEMGEQIFFHFKPERLYFFDPETGFNMLIPR
ncbi:MAG: ABC transporter ATP-binding protein [Candidatus Caldatribacteriaceae bacterium]